jgi:hypothetical protein
MTTLTGFPLVEFLITEASREKVEVGLIFDFRDVENRRCIRCDTLRIFPCRKNRRATQDPLSQQEGVLP